MDAVLAAVCKHELFANKPVGVKLAPYFDMPHFDMAATLLAKYPIAFVVCVNAIGNALFVDVDTESACIAPKGGYGGLAGGYVKQTALANVKKISEGLASHGRSDISVVGVGGVSTGADAFELILCGACAVQVGTCHWTEGAPCFARITHELEDIMRAKGYNSIEDFRGKLKPYVKGQKQRSKVAGAGAGTGTRSGDDKPEANTSSAAVINYVLVLVIIALLVERFKGTLAALYLAIGLD
jgi:dihydroorotate dehydrogenase